jgi:hypothetical protein
MAGALRGWSFLTCVWLSLTTVIAHAVLPVGSPLARRPGSAFSITTHDVSLRPSSRLVAGKARRLLAGDATDPKAAAGDAGDEKVWFAAEIVPALGSAPSAEHRLRPAVAPPESVFRPVFRARAPPPRRLA